MYRRLLPHLGLKVVWMKVALAGLGVMLEVLSGSRGIRGLDVETECDCVVRWTTRRRRSFAIYIMLVKDRGTLRLGGYLKDWPHLSVVLMQSSVRLMGSFCHSARFSAPIVSVLYGRDRRWWWRKHEMILRLDRACNAVARGD